ncbi:MAG: insulinase family protein [Bacteroidia bacterium]|nr:insulinase family protein [Bacteroidia bacterium]
MLFKGTDKYGTMDFSKEEPMLKKIEELYEKYRSTKDEKLRKSIYREIDSISGLASKYAIANEYDKMMSVIGAKGTNAYTWMEQTVYVNDIPSNQLSTWLDVESERFRNPVMRIFHTELEAVYEEKNISMDNDQDKLWENLFAGLFQKHTYGTQTTIGTVDHLKNPSIKKIREYYNTYYVPNNMAICLSGDLDPDATIKMIREKFSGWKKKDVPVFKVPAEVPFLKPVEKHVYGPNAETMVMAFRFNGAGTRDADLLNLISRLLYNGTAGIIDLDIVQEQKVLAASAFPLIMKDYSALVLSGDPKTGQKLEEVRDLLLQQIEKLKNGDFPDWMIDATINNIRYEEMVQMEQNRYRADLFVTAYVQHRKWEEVIGETNRLAGITRKDIMEFVKASLGNNYVCVYKHTGEDKNVQKVEKPVITPVEVNRDAASGFVQEIMSRKVQPIEPVFLNYETDIKKYYFKNRAPVYYAENTENKTFSVSFVIRMSNKKDRRVPIAVDYINYLGTSKYTPAALKQEFYKLACSYSVYASEENVHVNISGLTVNIEPALALLEQLLRDAKPDESALKNLVSDVLKSRADAKLNQDQILWSGMMNYGTYGNANPYKHMLSEKELTALKAEDLAAFLRDLINYEQEIFFYADLPGEKMLQLFEKHHPLPAEFKVMKDNITFTRLPNTETKVFVVDFDMKQAEILFLSKGPDFDPALIPYARMFNEYFGGGMGSVVFQDMRESKALAYSVFSSFSVPDRKEKPFGVMAYIGTQSDKLSDAMAGMMNLLTKMPQSELLFSTSKDALLQNIRSQRVKPSEMLGYFLNATKLGMNYDIRRNVFETAGKMTLADINSFHEKNISGKKYNIMILGKKSLLDMKTLEKYGKVEFLTLEQIFGY